MQKEQSFYSSSSFKNKTINDEILFFHKNHQFSLNDEINKNSKKDYNKEKILNSFILENLNLKKNDFINQVNFYDKNQTTEKNYEVESDFNFKDNFDNNFDYLFERENLETKIYGKFLDDSTSNYFNFDKNFSNESNSVSGFELKDKEKDFCLDYIKINNSSSTLHFLENKHIKNFKDSQVIEEINNEINIIKSKLVY